VAYAREGEVVFSGSDVAGPLSPALAIGDSILVEKAERSLSAHLLDIFGTLTADLRSVSGPSSITASVAIGLAYGPQGMPPMVLPILLMPPGSLPVDDRVDCVGVAPGDHPVCDMAGILDTWLDESEARLLPHARFLGQGKPDPSDHPCITGDFLKLSPSWKGKYPTTCSD
jgi:hypothetical protein